MKNKIISTLLVATLAFSLVACGSSDTGSTDTSSTDTTSSDTTVTEDDTADQEPITMVLALDNPWNENVAMQQAVEEVLAQEKYSYITFELIEQDVEYETTMPIAIAGGQQYDIVYAGNSEQSSKWMEAGLFLPLDEYAANLGFDFEENYGDYVDSINIVDGTTYVVPYEASSWALLYNKSIFDDAGIEYPSATEPMTWDEYDELALALTSGSGSEKIYGALELNWDMYWEAPAIISLEGTSNIFYTADGESNFGASEVADALEARYNRMFVDESIQTYADIATSSTQAQSFLNGSYGMFLGGQWALSWSADLEQYPRDWYIGCAPMPNDDGELVTWGDINSYAIASTSENPELAFEILVEILTLTAQYTEIPNAMISVEQSSVFESYEEAYAADGMTLEDMLYCFANPDTTVVGEKISGESQVDYSAIMQEEVELYFVQEQDLETTVNNVVERATELLSQD